MMTRILKKSVLVPLAGLAIPLFGKVPEHRPNVIFILADDLGYGELGCYGQKIIQTPNIDRLAGEGILFSQYYAGAPVSAPSRSTLQTGLHSGHTPIRGNNELPERGNIWDHAAVLADPSLEGQCPMPENTRTLGHLFQEHGYHTAIVGKWGLGYPGSVSTPDKMGYDFFYGYNCQREAHTYFPMYLYRNNQREMLDNAPLIKYNDKISYEDALNPDTYLQYRRKEFSCDLMFENIKQYVTEHSGSPFFLMWATPLPHVTLYAPDELVDHYHEIIGEEEPYLGTAGYLPCRYPRATYAAMITYLDQQIGELMQLLEQEGIAGNTMIVFASDNGATFNGGTDSPFFNSNGPFNAEHGWGKGYLTEGGIRVPMIIKWPGVIEDSRASDLICWSCDFMPTFADILGSGKEVTDGISLLHELKGKKQHEHEYLYWEFPGGGGQKAIRYGKWKGIMRGIRKGQDHIYLYNVETDPREQNDLSAHYPDIVARMRGMMDESHTEAQIKAFEF